ncbi:MAG: hypothetical protein D6689_22005 [Deltaproteobacteria bacterium]|nr:MAG: hypothetical protein D6689_22005 [Deltaproteobacteria bacterium]
MTEPTDPAGRTPRRRRRKRRRADAAPDAVPADGAADASGRADRPRRRRRRKRGRRDGAGPASGESPRPRAASRGATPADGRRATAPATAADAVDAGWDDDGAPAVATGAPAAADDGAAGEAGAPEAQDDGARDERWGDDADAPTPDVALAADLPPPPPDDDPDPATADLDDCPDADVDVLRPVRNVVGVKFDAAGKIYEFDAGDLSLARGDAVVVETERGTRIGTVAIPSVRRPHDRGPLKRVLRRPDDRDLRIVADNRARAEDALRRARAAARAVGLRAKVYRAEYSFSGSKLRIYVASEKRVDTRALARALARELSARIEIRQTGVRDEAKFVGGIGSCGLELCCSTFLPAFAPVSIKMAKDQGMVLNPHKVSGQCGRLKCCLVYEQQAYAALRKGLPKLGKRVIAGDRGEGRVVEVDVLRQRVRVAFGGGDFEVLPADAVVPKFPSQPSSAASGAKPGRGRRRDRGGANLPSRVTDDEPST